MAVEPEEFFPFLEEVDQFVDVAYVRYGDEDVVATNARYKPWVVDYNQEGQPVGLEVLDITQQPELPSSPEIVGLVRTFIERYMPDTETSMPLGSRFFMLVLSSEASKEPEWNPTSIELRKELDSVPE